VDNHCSCSHIVALQKFGQQSDATSVVLRGATMKRGINFLGRIYILRTYLRLALLPQWLS